MNWLPYLSAPIGMGSAYLFFLIYAKCRHVKYLDGTDIIKEPKVLLWIGIICTLFFLGFQIYFSITDFWPDLFLFLPFEFLGAFCILLYFNEAIIVGDEGLTHISAFGRRRYFRFSDVQIIENPRNLTWVVRRKGGRFNLCSVWGMQDNCLLLEKKYNEFNPRNGVTEENNPLKDSPKTGHKPEKGKRKAGKSGTKKS